jgi:hypothetical protein
VDEELSGYLHDLVILLHDNYNDSLQSNQPESGDEKAFRLGMNTAYYHVLTLIESQLSAFGYEPKLIGNITPFLGKQAKLK